MGVGLDFCGWVVRVRRKVERLSVMRCEVHELGAGEKLSTWLLPGDTWSITNTRVAV